MLRGMLRRYEGSGPKAVGTEVSIATRAHRHGGSGMRGRGKWARGGSINLLFGNVRGN